MAKFVLTTWAACLARQKPVSTSAKPACMKITSTAPMTIHRRFSDVAVVSTAVLTSSIVGGASWAPATPLMSRSAVPATPTATAAFVVRRISSTPRPTVPEPRWCRLGSGHPVPIGSGLRGPPRAYLASFLLRRAPRRGRLVWSGTPPRRWSGDAPSVGTGWFREHCAVVTRQVHISDGSLNGATSSVRSGRHRTMGVGGTPSSLSSTAEGLGYLDPVARRRELVAIELELRGHLLVAEPDGDRAARLGHVGERSGVLTAAPLRRRRSLRRRRRPRPGRPTGAG